MSPHGIPERTVPRLVDFWFQLTPFGRTGCSLYVGALTLTATASRSDRSTLILWSDRKARSGSEGVCAGTIVRQHGRHE